MAMPEQGMSVSISTMKTASSGSMDSKKTKATVIIPKKSSPIRVSIQKLHPYDYKRRGPFNFLRHPDLQPPMLPKKPVLAKTSVDQTTATTTSQAAKDQFPIATIDSPIDRFGRALVANPLMDFDLWSIEYNDQLSINDFKSMLEVIWKQEKTKVIEDGSSVSSDTYKGSGATATTVKSTSAKMAANKSPPAKMSIVNESVKKSNQKSLGAKKGQ